MENDQLTGAIEALIFVSGDPVPIKRLQDVLEIEEEEEIKQLIDTLSNRYLETGSGIQILEVAGGYQLRTRPTYSELVNRFLERKRKTTLSGPAMETLAIIAYKQPITRAEMEAIRGVAVDGVLKSLLDKRLIKVAGVKEVPGRPNLYRTTKRFLEYFGIKSLKDLPPIEEIEKTYSSSTNTEEIPEENTPETDFLDQPIDVEEEASVEENLGEEQPESSNDDLKDD
jgi:segregation and condensation protein B